VVYICIPAYNEARTIGVLLWKIRQVMAEFNRDYQLLVVDDASTDATPSVLEPYQRVLPLTVIRHAERRGYAASLEELLREAVRRSSYPRRDVIVTLQADFTEEPAEIPSFVKRIEGGADVVSSAARFEDSKAPRVVHWARRVLGFLVRRLRMPGTESDPFSGFRAYRVVCVKKALEGRGGAPILMRQGWAANAELLQAVQPYCRRHEVVPAVLRYDRSQRASRFSFWPTVREILRIAPPNTNSRSAEGAGLADEAAKAAKAAPAARRPRPSRRRGRRPAAGPVEAAAAGAAPEPEERRGAVGDGVEEAAGVGPAPARPRRPRGGRGRGRRTGAASAAREAEPAQAGAGVTSPTPETGREQASGSGGTRPGRPRRSRRSGRGNGTSSPPGMEPGTAGERTEPPGD